MVRRLALDSVDKIPPQVQLVRRYIEDHLGSPITMTQLAELSGLSPQHLNRLYQAAFDENPLDCLWRLRVRRGAYLLSHTGKQISQIVMKWGSRHPITFHARSRKPMASPPVSYAPRAGRASRLGFFEHRLLKRRRQIEPPPSFLPTCPSLGVSLLAIRPVWLHRVDRRYAPICHPQAIPGVDMTPAMAISLGSVTFSTSASMPSLLAASRIIWGGRLAAFAAGAINLNLFHISRFLP